MPHHLPATILSAVLLSAAAPALGQTTAPPPPSTGTEDAPGQAVPPSTDPCAAFPDAAIGQSLTSQLGDCGGVLTPPDIGTPGIEAPVPAPDPGTTPVIPPGAVPDQPDGSSNADPT